MCLQVGLLFIVLFYGICWTGVAVALKQAMTPEFKAYQVQVLANCKALAAALMEKGYKIVTGKLDVYYSLANWNWQLSKSSSKWVICWYKSLCSGLIKWTTGIQLIYEYLFRGISNKIWNWSYLPVNRRTTHCKFCYGASYLIWSLICICFQEALILI